MNQATCSIVAQVLPTFLLTTVVAGGFIHSAAEAPSKAAKQVLSGQVIAVFIVEVLAIVGAGQTDGLPLAGPFVWVGLLAVLLWTAIGVMRSIWGFRMW